MDTQGLHAPTHHLGAHRHQVDARGQDMDQLAAKIHNSSRLVSTPAGVTKLMVFMTALRDNISHQVDEAGAFILASCTEQSCQVARQCVHNKLKCSLLIL